MNKLLILLATIISFSSSFATLITYDNRDSWESLLVSFTKIDFEGHAPTSKVVAYDAALYSVKFSSPDPIFFVDEKYYEARKGFSLGTGDVLVSRGNSASLTASDFNVNALGMNLGGYSEAETPFQLTFSDGSIVATTVKNPGGGFLGVISDKILTSVSIAPSQAQSRFVILDNFSIGTSIGTVAAVPEPGIFTLMVLSMAGLVVAVRKKVF